MTCQKHAHEKVWHLDCDNCRADLERPRRFEIRYISHPPPAPIELSGTTEWLTGWDLAAGVTDETREALQCPLWFLAWDDGVRH